MTKIKICGITRQQDIEALNQLMPDYAGLVFAKSKRQVSIPKASLLASGLSDKIQRVGVFADMSVDHIVRTALEIKLDILQLHSNETARDIQYLKERTPCKIIKAIRVKEESDLNDIDRFRADFYLLDSYHPQLLGGTGEPFSWMLAKTVAARGDVFLAGGLTAANVGEAVQILHPYAVDVSSSVETAGWKDFEKIKRFIEAVRGKNHVES